MSDIPQTVAQAFIKTTTAVPEKEAIVSADGRRYSYAELRREVERIVQALQALGYGPGDRVAVWLANRPE
ncbi:MAG: AMP-binding protein, partial [Candidatus Tectomicrobia bacterium]